MVSGMHRLLLREGRNNRSNPDFQTFFEGFRITSNFIIPSVLNAGRLDIGTALYAPFNHSLFYGGLFSSGYI